jgi:hypothetical protein
MSRVLREPRLFGGRVLLAATLLYAVGALVVSISYLWTPVGTFGFNVDYGTRVASVDPGGPATEAGIVPNDHLDLGTTPFASRPYVVGVTVPVPPGTKVTFTLLHAGVPRTVTLTAAERVMDPESQLSRVFALGSTALFLIVGAWLIVLRQSRVTWGFGLYCLLTNPAVPALARFPSAQAHLVYVGMYDVLQNVGVVGLLVFALNFPRTLQRGWRVTLERLLPAIFVLLAGWTLWIDLAICVFAHPVDLPNRLLQLAFGSVDIVAIVLITETYLAGPVEDRARLRWVLIGFYVGLVCNFLGNVLLYTGNVSLPVWVDNILIALVVTLPLTVAYAIVRHRVIDTDFFISRAIVYAVLTTALVAVFALIDWVFGRLLADYFRLSLFVDALASIGAALSFDAVHKRVERVVDEVLFRARRIARERLERATRAIRHATAPAAIDTTLIKEPQEALELASIALFRHDDTGYRRVAAIGWPDDACDTLDDNDRLVLEHRAHETVVTLADLPWTCANLPEGALAPTISVPLRTRGDVEGLLLCSGTSHGEQLDPEEASWIMHLAEAATTTHDELAAESARDRAAASEEQVNILEARLDEVRRDASLLKG